MMAHTTFYRKYRSANFGEMIGQSHIIRTLSNAVTANRLSQAYIFSGPRGTGKTSSARIFSKGLNCRKGPTPTPCGTCDLCQKITLGQSVDVIEIDAASHTGVDNIRVVNEQVGFAPVECRYRMFIIDEVHMLSSGAFNALLKTLEEPPKHVVFILATTEPHKIPATIHSRCQHLQFRSLSVADIVGHLRYISDLEQLTVSDNALQMVARNASGCMRDALSLFDQLAAYGGQTIQDEDVSQLLGAASVSLLSGIVKAMITAEPAEVVRQLIQVEQLGVHPTQLLSDLIEMMKVVMGQKLGVDISTGFSVELDLPIQSVPFGRIQAICEGLARAQMDIKYFPDPLLLIQIRCAKLAMDSVVPTPVPKPSSRVESTASPESIPPQVEPNQDQKKSESPTSNVVDHLKRLKEMQMATMNRQIPADSQSRPIQDTKVKAVTAPQPKPFGQIDPGLDWEGFLADIKQVKPPLHTILNDSTVLKVSGELVTIRLKQDFQFFREKLREPASVDILNDAFDRCFKRRLRILFDGETDPIGTPGSTGVTLAMPMQPVVVDSKMRKLNHIIAMFDGAIVEN